ncbi:phage head spike fiber domain-containing protein [Roseomonas sp. USHLN139]|uniref:phage head spike fiber domain-containing protein n=1 Tax=Roseomonas sp. USHLN139 TaxID=3081298 RepID=UPI003B01038E
MFQHTPMAGAVTPETALRLLGPGFTERLAVSRAGAALAQDAAGLWQPAAADTPRFQGPARRLLVEEARGNLLRNPRAEGAVAGTPGTPPTTWTTFNSAGLSLALAGTGVEDNIPFTDWRLSGTATAAGQVQVKFEAATRVVAAQGETWTGSFFARIAAGALPAGIVQALLIEYTAVGGFLSESGADIRAVTSAPLRGQRWSHTRTLASASTGRLLLLFRTNIANAEVVDLTIRLGWPQLEKAGFASSPILPAAGTPAAASRAADAPAWQPAGGFGPEGTLLLQALLPRPAGSTPAGLLQLDDGSDTNRLVLRNAAGGSAIQALAIGGGATLATLAGGTMVAGTAFRAALAWSGTELALCLNGGAVQTATAALPAGLTRLLAGHGNAALTQAANGELALLDYRPVRLPDAMLQALSAP